jgi:prepilin-type N-terminal cleavage/methylation domain-containing protein
MIKYMQKLKGKKGFTLVECLVAITIFAIMAMMVAVLLDFSIRTHRDNMSRTRSLREQRSEIVAAGAGAATLVGRGDTVDFEIDFINSSGGQFTVDFTFTSQVTGDAEGFEITKYAPPIPVDSSNSDRPMIVTFHDVVNAKPTLSSPAVFIGGAPNNPIPDPSQPTNPPFVSWNWPTNWEIEPPLATARSYKTGGNYSGLYVNLGQGAGWVNGTTFNGDHYVTSLWVTGPQNLLRRTDPITLGDMQEQIIINISKREVDLSVYNVIGLVTTHNNTRARVEFCNTSNPRSSVITMNMNPTGTRPFDMEGFQLGIITERPITQLSGNAIGGNAALYGYTPVWGDGMPSYLRMERR